MVNASRAEKKLLSLLVDGEPISRANWAARRKIEYRLTRFRKQHSA